MNAAGRFVRLEHREHASVVTLERPERLNAIGPALLAELHDALQAAQAHEHTGAIVFTGAGRAFCAGDDLQEFDVQAATAQSAADMGARIQQITRDLMLGPKFVIGACHGYAVGGGFEWLLNCDMVVAADDLVGFFPEMNLGHFVTGGVTHLLPLAVGHQRAMEMLVLGARYDARQLLQLGLVNRVVARAEMLETALGLAGEVAARAPHAVALLKKAVHARAAALEAALAVEEQAALACFLHPATAKRVAAAAPRKKPPLPR